MKEESVRNLDGPPDVTSRIETSNSCPHIRQPRCPSFLPAEDRQCDSTSLRTSFSSIDCETAKVCLPLCRSHLGKFARVFLSVVLLYYILDVFYQTL